MFCFLVKVVSGWFLMMLSNLHLLSEHRHLSDLHHTTPLQYKPLRMRLTQSGSITRHLPQNSKCHYIHLSSEHIGSEKILWNLLHLSDLRHTARGRPFTTSFIPHQVSQLLHLQKQVAMGKRESVVVLFLMDRGNSAWQQLIS